MGYGDDYQKKSKYSRESLRELQPDWEGQVPPYKTYPENYTRFELERPQPSGGPPLLEILQKRRSVRDYSSGPLDNKTLSFLLWASQGITLKTEYINFRTAPSAGGLYPIETYLAVNNVSNIQSGIYHYEVLYHTLAQIDAGSKGQELAKAALGQRMLADAPVVFIFSAIIQRSRSKYGQRAYRYIYMDAGHITQNLALGAVSCRLGSCQIGAFLDDEVNQIIGLDGKDESVIYMSTVGAENR